MPAKFRRSWTKAPMFDFGDPVGGAYSAPQPPFLDLRGSTSKGRRRWGKGGDGRRGKVGEWRGGTGSRMQLQGPQAGRCQGPCTGKRWAWNESLTSSGKYIVTKVTRYESRPEHLWANLKCPRAKFYQTWMWGSPRYYSCSRFPRITPRTAAVRGVGVWSFAQKMEVLGPKPFEGPIFMWVPPLMNNTAETSSVKWRFGESPSSRCWAVESKGERRETQNGL